jgi:hypothetical protein
LGFSHLDPMLRPDWPQVSDAQKYSLYIKSFFLYLLVKILPVVITYPRLPSPFPLDAPLKSACGTRMAQETELCDCS